MGFFLCFFSTSQGAGCSSVITHFLILRWFVGSNLIGGHIDPFLVPASTVQLM